MFNSIFYELKIVKKELFITLIVLMISFFIALLNGLNNYSHLNETYQNNLKNENTRFSDLEKEAIEQEKIMLSNWEDLDSNRKGPRSPAKVGNAGALVSLPPLKSYFIAIGQTDIYPISMTLNLGIKESFASTSALENPNKMMIGNFDISFVIIWILPLIIITLFFDLVSSEKESGLIKVLLTQSISIKDLIFSRVIIRTSILMFSIISLILFCLLYSDIAITSFLSLFLIISVSIYSLFWISICLFINSKGLKPSVNAIYLSLIWILLVIIIPSLINLVSTSMFPVPSKLDYIRTYTEEIEEIRTKGSQILGKYFEDHPELSNSKVDTSKVSVMQVIRDESIEKHLKPVREEFYKKAKVQKDFINLMKYLSPSITMQYTLYDLAGTSTNRYDIFNDQVDNFHNEWKKFFVTKIMSSKPVYQKDYKILPKFSYYEESFKDILFRSIKALFLVFIFSIIFLVISIKNLNKYNPIH